MRGFVRRHWRVVTGAAVVLLLAIGGGIQAFRTVGFGHGPLTIVSVNSFGTIPRGHPAVAVVPVVVDPSQVAVIDSVVVKGGDARRGPDVLTVVGDRATNCAGIWWPIQGVFRNTFFSRCAPHGTIPVIGHPVQVADVSTDASTGSGGDGRVPDRLRRPRRPGPPRHRPAGVSGTGLAAHRASGPPG